jgi:hypothetical protein
MCVNSRSEGNPIVPINDRELIEGCSPIPDRHCPFSGNIFQPHEDRLYRQHQIDRFFDYRSLVSDSHPRDIRKQYRVERFKRTSPPFAKNTAQLYILF